MIQQYNSNKTAQNFDIDKELSTHTFIKPLPSNGYLVKNTIFDLPAELFKDIKYDLKAIKHSITGDANDHELGRLNDIGMKAGGLGIATYLFTRKGTPLPKLMEFIGLGTFFAAMDIWPKVALQLPAYLIHGVNVRQKYVDNYGRKKFFYQDNQFIPWDLYSDDDINKIGDRMGVPKDMKNRRDYIQEKMRKIALQNNTMWMLTSGFSTPIISALICDSLQKPILNWQKRHIEQKANNLLKNLKDEADKIDFSKENKALESILSGSKNKIVTPKLLEEIAVNISSGLDPKTAGYVLEDLKNIFPQSGTYNVNEGNISEVVKTIQKAFSSLNISEFEFSQIVPDENAIRNLLVQQGLIKDNIRDFSEHTKAVQNLLVKNIEEYLKNHPDSPIKNSLNVYRLKLIHQTSHGETSALTKAFSTTPSGVLTEQNIDFINSIAKIIHSFAAKNSTF